MQLLMFIQEVAQDVVSTGDGYDNIVPWVLAGVGGIISTIFATLLKAWAGRISDKDDVIENLREEKQGLIDRITKLDDEKSALITDTIGAINNMASFAERIPDSVDRDGGRTRGSVQAHADRVIQTLGNYGPRRGGIDGS